jgi:hypothetical protein
MLRRPSRRVSGLGALAGVLLVQVSLPARAETLAEIEGLSLTVNWMQRAQGADPSGHYTFRDTPWSLRLYISSKGNVFVYPAATNGINPGPQVYTIGAVEDHGDGYAVTWAMADGHLTDFIKYAQGATDVVFAIDPARLTCSFELRHHYDPQTGLITPRGPNGVYRMRLIETRSSSCAVTRGNIFATD